MNLAVLLRPGRYLAPCLAALWLSAAALAPCAVAGESTAGKDAKSTPAPTETAPEKPAFNLSGEFGVWQSYVGTADVRRNGRSTSLDEYNSRVNLVFTPRVPLGYLRLGAEWTRYSFGFGGNGGAPLPNTLQSVNLVLGLDTSPTEAILLRVEVQPGLYGTFFNHLSLGQVRVPFIIGGTYIYSPDIQIIAGISVDYDRQFPVIPGVGLRWKFAPNWVLNATLPNPRLEYTPSRATTLYVGADLRNDSFRTEDRPGTTRLDRRLNRALVTFSEVRVGGGLVQKLFSSVELAAEAGCQTLRQFDFQRADIRYRTDGVAPYGQLMLRGSF